MIACRSTSASECPRAPFRMGSPPRQESAFFLLSVYEHHIPFQHASSTLLLPVWHLLFCRSFLPAPLLLSYLLCPPQFSFLRLLPLLYHLLLSFSLFTIFRFFFSGCFFPFLFIRRLLFFCISSYMNVCNSFPLKKPFFTSSPSSFSSAPAVVP